MWRAPCTSAFANGNWVARVTCVSPKLQKPPGWDLFQVEAGPASLRHARLSTMSPIPELGARRSSGKLSKPAGKTPTDCGGGGDTAPPQGREKWGRARLEPAAGNGHERKRSTRPAPVRACNHTQPQAYHYITCCIVSRSTSLSFGKAYCGLVNSLSRQEVRGHCVAVQSYGAITSGRHFPNNN